MKVAMIDDFAIIYYSNCFACKQVVISKIKLLENNTTDQIAWAINVILLSPKWKWMRTGNCTCQKTCDECIQKKKQMTRLVLTRGYGVPRAVPRPKTLPDLVQMLGMGRIERITQT